MLQSYYEGQWRSQGGASRGQAPVVETRPRLSKLGWVHFLSISILGPTEILQRQIHSNDGVHCANMLSFSVVFQWLKSDWCAFHINWFRYWKDATGQKGRLIEHRKSMVHVEAVLTWEEYKLNLQRETTIIRSLEKMGMNVIKENRHYIKTIAEIILLCATQEIALRGTWWNRTVFESWKFSSITDFYW